MVTPCVGVWIEIDKAVEIVKGGGVTPCVGVWIEIRMLDIKRSENGVTPCVGVWIEMIGLLSGWIRRLGHSLRGSVD